MTATSKYREIQFSDEDVVDIDEWIPAGEYNPHNIRPWLLHDHGYVVCVVFASNESDALDAAVDADKMDRYLLDITQQSTRDDYMTKDPEKMAAGYDPNCPGYVAEDGTKYWWEIEPCYLGNAGEPFDLDTLGLLELHNPAKSFCALYNHLREQKGK